MIATKGLESGTLLRMSQVLSEVLRPRFEPQIAVLSGPTFAREVARGEPTAVVVASTNAATAATVQAAFSGPSFRLYTNADLIGVEIGGALKNVIAIAAGVVQGLGLGNNTQAALITRGLAEITRLAVAMGAQPATLAGLAGLGDLVLTCGGELSRNRRVGIELARGRSLADITASTPMIAEGVETCGAAVALGAKYGVDLPIICQMDAVLHRGKDPARSDSRLDGTLAQGRVVSGALGFSHFRGQRRHDFEQIADDSVIGHFEDRSVGIFVDRDDGLRALHPHQVLNRAGDADGDVDLGRHRLAGAADLPLHGKPSRVADRPRRGQFGAERLGQLFHHRNVGLAP